MSYIRLSDLAAAPRFGGGFSAPTFAPVASPSRYSAPVASPMPSSMPPLQQDWSKAQVTTSSSSTDTTTTTPAPGAPTQPGQWSSWSRTQGTGSDLLSPAFGGTAPPSDDLPVAQTRGDPAMGDLGSSAEGGSRIWPWIVGLAGIGLGAWVVSRFVGVARSPEGRLHARVGGTPVFNEGHDAPPKGEMTRGVLYARGETGWVESLGDGTFRVANVPLDGPFNIDDVVTLKKKRGDLALDKLVSRVFPKKSGIRYPAPYTKNYRALAKAFHAEGWRLEGGVEGLALLAHKGRKSPRTVAQEAGVEITAEALLS